jgi:hypothetical protein
VSVGVEEDVVGFDVAVDVAQPVDRVDGQHHFGQVEFGHILGQPILKLGQERQQVTAAVIIHHQVLRKNRKKKQMKMVLTLSGALPKLQSFLTFGNK